MTTGNDTQDLRVLVSYDNGSQLTGTYWSRVWSGGDSAPTPPSSSNVYPPGQELTRSNWSRPPRRGRGKGEHAYDMTLVSLYNPAGWYYSSGSQKSSTYSGLAGNCAYYSKWTVQDDYKLISQLKELLLGSDFNPAVSLAEANQALGTIFGVARALDGAISHARRGNFAAAAKSVAGYERGQGRKVPANLHLGYQYGVKPMLSDAYNAAKTVAHLTSVPMQKSYTVKRTVRGVAESAAPSLSYFSAAYGSDTGKIKAVLKEVSTVGLLGLANPASIIWEKVPYSFVVDWFVPIGAFLDARGVAQSLTGTFVTTRVTKFGVANPHPVPASIKFSPSWSEFRYRSVTVKRTVSSSLQVPLPSIKPLSKMLSWTRAASAVALLTQRHR